MKGESSGTARAQLKRRSGREWALNEICPVADAAPGDESHSRSAISKAALSIGATIVAEIATTLAIVRQPAVVMDRTGAILETNPAADALFGDDVRVVARRLLIQDNAARAALAALLDQIRTSPETATIALEPILARREGKPRLLI